MLSLTGLGWLNTEGELRVPLPPSCRKPPPFGSSVGVPLASLCDVFAHISRALMVALPPPPQPPDEAPTKQEELEQGQGAAGGDMEPQGGQGRAAPLVGGGRPREGGRPNGTPCCSCVRSARHPRASRALGTQGCGIVVRHHQGHPPRAAPQPGGGNGRRQAVPGQGGLWQCTLIGVAAVRHPQWKGDGKGGHPGQGSAGSQGRGQRPSTGRASTEELHIILIGVLTL